MTQTTDTIVRFLGVDTGGTFTDFVLIEPAGLRIHKVLSTPLAPEQAILQGVEEMGLMSAAKAGQLVIVHGSTVATNAALEGKGVRTAYVTNKGFADTLTLARQNRTQLYALEPAEPEPPVPAELCLEVDCRRDAAGQEVKPLKDSAIEALVQHLHKLEPAAVAINLLFSFLNDAEEKRLEKALTDRYFVSRSSEVLPEYKEYERGMATWLNAYLGPKVESYIRNLARELAPAPLAVMQSSGGTIEANEASRRAVNLLLSGPAGGLAAARHIGQQIGQSRLLTFDMGGTSTDVALIDGDIRLTSEGRLGPYPVAVPMVDMHTIGAGGGSIARVDSGGLLHVGPESAGASPGPACYGRGGQEPTVTDANAVLGRLRPEHFLGGKMALDVKAAEKSLTKLAESLGSGMLAAARGVIALANEHMARALRVISVQRGYNPRDFTLCCFGGAGGLHVCALAESLGMNRALIPANGGVFSAYGMLVAPPQRQLSRTLQAPLATMDHSHLNTALAELATKGEAQLRSEGAAGALSTVCSLDLRYQGQSFYLNLPYEAGASASSLTAAFHDAHEQAYGHAMNLPVELVNIRIAVTAKAPPLPQPQATPQDEPPVNAQHVELVDLGFTQICQRETLPVNEIVTGPAIVCERVATTLVAHGWHAHQDHYGHLHLNKTDKGRR